MKWIESISQVFEYIEKNLEGTICLDELSKVANCSVGHIQKVFSYLTDMTISEYIRQRKMTLAGFDLKQKNRKVIEIAYKYGYTSPTAFTRAFKNVHGVSPSTAINNQSVLTSFSPINFSIQMLGGESMNYRIENKKAMRVVGVRVLLSYEKEEDIVIVPNFWNRILVSDTYRQLCEMSATGYLYGVTDSTNKDTSYYYICVETEKALPHNMYELLLPAVQRVIFENNGRFKESIQQAFKRFLLEWLPFSHYEYEGSPDIEVYPINAEKKKEGHSEIWIAIKEEKI